MQTTVPSGGCAGVGEAAAGDGGAVVAQEVDRLAHVAERVGQRLAGFANDQPGELAGLALVARRGGGEDRRAFGRRARRPGRAALRRGGESALDVLAARRRRPRRRRRRNRRDCGSAAPCRAAPPARHSVRALLASHSRERGEARLVAEVEPGGIRPRRRIEVARQRDLRDAARRPARSRGPPRPGLRSASSIDTDASAIWLTNEVLAPFSSRRRTR